MQAHTSDGSAAETQDQAHSRWRTIDRLDVAAGLLHHWWIVVLVWVAVTIWLAVSLGS